VFRQLILDVAKQMHNTVVGKCNYIGASICCTILFHQSPVDQEVALTRMCEYVLILDGDPNFTWIIQIGASYQPMLVVLIAFKCLICKRRFCDI